MVTELRTPVRLTDNSWRMSGCGERCQTFWVEAVGRAYAEKMVCHDPGHHEAYGANVLIREYALLDGRVIRTGALTLNGLTSVVAVGRQRVHLTPRESGILFYLGANLDRTCPAVELLHAVWGSDYATEIRTYGGRRVPADVHLLRVNMARVRAKLGDAARLIETHAGSGYRLIRKEPTDG